MIVVLEEFVCVCVGGGAVIDQRKFVSVMPLTFGLSEGWGEPGEGS